MQPASIPSDTLSEQRRRMASDAEASAALVERLEALPQGADAVVEVAVELLEEPFDFGVLRGLDRDDDSRQALRAARQAQLAPSRERFAAVVRGFGGEVIGASSLLNQVDVVVPVRHLRHLLAHDDVVFLSEHTTVGGQGQAAADGLEIREAAFGTRVPVQDGGAGARVDQGEILFGVIEWENTLNTTHVAWRDWAGGPSRILDTDDCGFNLIYGYICNGAASGSSSSHGTRVTGILLGSLEQGQDPNYPTAMPPTDAQIARSGVAREAEALYFSAGSSGAFRAAVEESVWRGVDVINSSTWVGSQTACSGTVDWGGIRGAIMAAENAGVLFVNIAGNARAGRDCSNGGVCTVAFPGCLTDSMAIGGLEATNGADYPNADLEGRSGCGRAVVQLAGGRSVRAPMVDLVTFGQVESQPGAGANSYVGVDWGTSYATPIVAGAAALTREWMFEHGWANYNDAYAVRLNLLLMGDSTWSNQARARYSIHWEFGFGRLLYRYLGAGTSQLGGTGGWGNHEFLVQQGQTVSWTIAGGVPIPAAVNAVKLAAIADENTYGDMPDLHFRVVDTCPPAGGEADITTAARYAGRWRMVLDESTQGGGKTGIVGRCLEARITVDGLNGQSRIWAGDYYFSNSDTHHLQ